MSRSLARDLLGAPGRWLAVALAALAVLALPGLARIGIDNRIERWLSPEGERARDYARFEALFGDDAFVLVAYGGRDPLAADGLAAGLAAAEALEATPHVAAVLGPPLVHRDLLGSADPEALRRLLLDTPFYRRFLVSESGDWAGLLLATELGDDASAPRRLADGVRSALRPLAEAGFDVHVVGPPVLNVALDEASQREAQRTFPVAFALSIALLALLFRCARSTTVAVACTGLTLLLTFGAVGVAGVSLNMVTSVLPSLLWVLSLSGSIHVLRRFQVHRGDGLALEPALEAALDETARPSVVAAVTTAMGFGSLLVASMPPVRELGAFAALGMLFSLGVNLAVGPRLLRLARPPAPRRRGQRPQGHEPLPRWQRLPFRHPRAVLVGATLLAALAVVGAARIRIDSDPLAFLPDDAPVVLDYEAVARHLTGYYALEVMLELPDSWESEASWPAIASLERALAAEPGVARVLSPLDLLRQLHYWEDGGPDGYALPADGAAARSLLADYGSLTAVDGFPLVADGGRTVRLAALVDVMPSSRFAAIEAAARGGVDALALPLSGTVTGIVSQLVDAQLALVRTQIESFGLAFLAIFGSLWVGLRSARLALLSIAPNLLPILVALGAMGFAGVALDAATVMMASVALGIAVDDTVHVLATYEAGQGRPARRARETMARVGSAMWITSAVACIGFLALDLSDFLPIRWFGLLSALAVTVALLADAWLTPALLLLRERGEQAP